MDPAVLVAIEKLNKLLDTLLGKTGKRGVSKDEITGVLPSPDGSTLVEEQGPSQAWVKKAGDTLGIGKLAKKQDIISQARSFAIGFLPELRLVLEDFFKPLSGLDKLFTKKTKESLLPRLRTPRSPAAKGGTGIGFDRFTRNLGSIAKSVLLFVPALAAFTFIAKEWKNIEVSTVLKLLGGMGALFAGIIAFDKFKGNIQSSFKSVGIFLLEVVGLSGAVYLFGEALKGWESIELSSIGKVGLVIGGISGLVTLLSKMPVANTLKGAASLALIGLVIAGINYILPPLTNTLNMMEGVDWPSIGKVATIITGIGVILAAAGLVAPLIGVGTLAMVGILGTIFGINMVLPPLAHTLELMEGVNWASLGKVATILTGVGLILAAAGVVSPLIGLGTLAMVGIAGAIKQINEVFPPLTQTLTEVGKVEYGQMLKVATILGGLGLILTAAGALSPFIGLGVVAFSGIIGLADKMSDALVKIGDSVRSVATLSEDDINKSFNLLKGFITGSGILFSGEGFFGKVGSFFKNLISGTGAKTMIQPYIELASSIANLSGFIKTTITNVGQIGGVDSVNNAMNVLKAFINGTEMFSGFSTSSVRGITESLEGLVPVVSGITILTTKLNGLSNTLTGISTSNPFGTFENAKVTIDSLINSVDRLKTSFGNLDVKNTISIVSDQPLKVDMKATNDILAGIYQASLQMVESIKSIPGGNIVMPQPGGAPNKIQTGTAIGRGGESYSDTPYMYKSQLSY